MQTLTLASPDDVVTVVTLLRDAGIRAGGARIHDGVRTYGILRIFQDRDLTAVLGVLAKAAIRTAQP
jgi:hypothetical protein